MRQLSRSGLSRVELSAAQGIGKYSIGEAAAASGVSAKMIRHYEAIGLIGKVGRTFGNYRIYGETNVHTLRFIRRARALGFSIRQIKELLSLWQDRRRASAKVRALALEHVELLEAKARELEAIAATLRDLANRCHGDDRPDCPIIDELALPESRLEKRAP
jgi:Cu(I)-responsive transcriptional regulator